jgi:rare lipoprotein A (peptidoglycan hydrolase)
MITWRPSLAVLSLSVGLWALTTPVFAQSFDDRWSIIPKANADEPGTRPEPQQKEQPSSPPQAPNSAPQTQAPAETVGQAEPSAPPPHPKALATTRGKAAPKRAFTGKASYISYAGGKTASGASYRPLAFTAAHRTLPFGTRVQVTDVKTGKSVQVTITDRGPAIRNRVLDLSRGAAQALGMIDRGIIQVRAQVVENAAPPVVAKGQ